MGSSKLGSMIAREYAEIGTAETGNNIVKYNKEYYGTSILARTKYGPWCAVYQSWCAKKCGVTTIYQGSLCSDLAKKYNNSGKYRISKFHGGSYKPKVGDLAFISKTRDPKFSSISHIAFVANIDGNGNIWTIDGNAQDPKDRVFKVMYKLRNINDSDIVGFASIAY